MDPEEEQKLFEVRLTATGTDDCPAVFPDRPVDAYPQVPVIPCDPDVDRPDEVFLPPNEPPAEPLPPSLLPEPLVVRNRARAVVCPVGQSALVGVSPTLIVAGNPDLDVLVFLDDIAAISQDELFRLAAHHDDLQDFVDNNLAGLVGGDITAEDFDADLVALLSITPPVAATIRAALVTAQNIADETADALATSQLRCGWRSQELWVTCDDEGGYNIFLADPGGESATAPAGAATSTVSQADANDKAARVLALQELNCVAGNDEVTVTCPDLDEAYDATLEWPVTPGTYSPLAAVHLSTFDGQAFMTIDEVSAGGTGRVLKYSVTIAANDPRAIAPSKAEANVIAENLALQELDCFFPSRPLRFTCSEENESAAGRLAARSYTDNQMLAEMATGSSAGDHTITTPDNLGIIEALVDTVDTRVALRVFSPAGFLTGSTEVEALEAAENRALSYLSCLWTSPEHVCKCVEGIGPSADSFKFPQSDLDENDAKFAEDESTASNTLPRGQFISDTFPGETIGALVVWPDLDDTCQAALTCYFETCKVVFCSPKPDDRTVKVSGEPNYASWGASWLLGPSNQAQQLAFYDAWTEHCDTASADTFSGNCRGIPYNDVTDCLAADLEGSSPWDFTATGTGLPARFKYGGVLKLEHTWRNPEAGAPGEPDGPPLIVEGQFLACSITEPAPGDLWQVPDPWGCFSGAEGYAKQLTPIGLGEIAAADAVSRLDCTHVNWPRVIAHCPGTGQRPTEDTYLDITVEADSTRAANEQLEAMILQELQCKEAHGFALTVHGGKVSITAPSVANVGGKDEDCMPPGLSPATLWTSCETPLPLNGAEMTADANSHYFILAGCCDNVEYKKLFLTVIPSSDSYETILHAKQRGELGTADSRAAETSLRLTGDEEVWYLGSLGVKDDDSSPAKKKRVILQGHTGPIVMAKPCCKTSSSSDSSDSSGFHGLSSSSDSSSSDSSSSGPSDSGSDKSTAIVPAPWLGTDRFVMLYCLEAPEVRFDDTAELHMSHSKQTFMVDHRYVKVCEPGTLRVCSGIDSFGRPARVLMRTEGAMHYITVGLCWASRMERSLKPKKVLVRFTGIRKGFLGVRFEECSRADYEQNELFLKMARIPKNPKQDG